MLPPVVAAAVRGQIQLPPGLDDGRVVKCLTGDVLGSQRRDCGPQLREAVRDWTPTRQNLALGFAKDERDYTVAAQMLRALGVDQLDLLTNNPDKATQLQSAGIRVNSRVPTGVHLSPANGRYLAAKGGGGHHLLHVAQ